MIKDWVLGIGFIILLTPGCGKPAGESRTVSSNGINVATIQLPTLKCKNCVRTVKSALDSVDGVENAEINLDARTATVKFIAAKLDVSNIESAISKAGYDADNVKRDSTAYENLAECCK